MEYRSLLTIVKDVSEINDAHIAYAGTLGDDTIVIPNGLTTNSTGEQTGSWGEIYLNDGDDNLTLPDTFYIDGDTNNPNTSFLYYAYGGEGDDTIQGGSGDDYILGDDGDDTIDGGDGNDRLVSGSGDDKLYGRNGDDTLVLNGVGTMLFDGGSGNDTVEAQVNNDDIWSPPEGFGSLYADLTTGEMGAIVNDVLIPSDTLQSIENINYFTYHDVNCNRR